MELFARYAGLIALPLWVSKPLGGFWIGSAWIPYAYLVWSFISIILWFFL